LLGYLEELCAALLAHDGGEIRRLLRHPLARALPRSVREEGYSIARAGKHSFRAPIQTLHFYHQTTHLLLGVDARANGQKPDHAARSNDRVSPEPIPQLELPLAANQE
jgi:hypothetical protein